MSHDPTASDPLEQARDMVWEALRLVEDAQRALFRAGDRYVAEVWGDGVRSVIEATERLTEISGEMSSMHIELGHLERRHANRLRGGGNGQGA
jgi:hypothetical protein